MLLLLIMDGDIKPPFPRDPFTVWNLLTLAVGVCSVMGLGLIVATYIERLFKKPER
jgi:hypothetical protein